MIFTFPFLTIKNVARVDDEHIIVANDNELPFAIGRFTDRDADNAFILLRVPELLEARARGRCGCSRRSDPLRHRPDDEPHGQARATAELRCPRGTAQREGPREVSGPSAMVEPAGIEPAAQI